MTEEKNIQFKFHSLQENIVNINSKPSDFDDSSFNFSITATQKVNETSNLLIVVVHVIIENNNSTYTLATIEVYCAYEIINFSEYIKSDDKGVYCIPDILTGQTNLISISTTRGYMYSILKGTYLQKAFLPIVTLDQFKKYEG